VLRVITDPEPDLGPSAEVQPALPALEDLIGSVVGLAWIVGPTAPRTVARVQVQQVRVLVSDGVAELPVVVENTQSGAAPLLVVPSRFRAARGGVWSPRADPATVLLGAGETRAILVRLRSAVAPEPGSYEGGVELLGIEGGLVSVLAEVTP
jgi:hypothetical protein